MAGEQSKPNGPDLSQGVSIDDIRDGGMVGGVVDDEFVLLARCANEFFAIEATCSHYGGPLAEGLIVGDTVRCPWHHACFSLRTGAGGRQRLRLIQCRVGGLKRATAKFSCAKSRVGQRTQAQPGAVWGVKTDSCSDRGRGRCGVCCGRYATARRVWR